MPDDLTLVPDVDLRYMLRDGRIVLKSVAFELRKNPGVLKAIQRLRKSTDVVETFRKMAAEDPQLMAAVLNLSSLAMINVLGMDSVGAELCRRAATEN